MQILAVVATLLLIGCGVVLIASAWNECSVYATVIPDRSYVYLLMIGYISRSGVFYSLADSHFGLAPTEVVVFRHRVEPYTSTG